MRKISWEIVLTGIILTIVAAFLYTNSDEDKNVTKAEVHVNSGKSEDTPKTIILDLKNLENLEQLKQLEQLKELKQLGKLKEIFPKEADSVLQEALNKIEKELSGIEQDKDYKIEIVDDKLVVKKDYQIKEGSWSNISPGVYAYEQHFETSSLQNAAITLEFGNITVIGTDESTGSLNLKASGDLSNVSDLQNGLKTIHNINDESVSFEVRKDIAHQNNLNIQLEAILTVPKPTGLTASTEGGHIRIENINGVQDISTLGGHIKLHDVSGTVSARTGGGHITAENMTGDIELKTSGGHLKLVNCNGNATLMTSGGNINIQEMSGPVEAKTNSGNIDIGFTTLSGPVSVTTSAGDILLKLPSTADANLLASGTSVSIAESIPFSGSKSKTRAEGTIGDGGSNLKATCQYGNVVIKTNGQ